MTDDSRRDQVQRFEIDAEWLTIQQLDLLAQLEAQLRTVRQTMRQIEQLRGAGYRVGPELSDDQRTSVLMTLTSEVATLGDQLTLEGSTCHDMLEIIQGMQQRLTEWVGVARTATKS
jgi:hypothetical protein